MKLWKRALRKVAERAGILTVPWFRRGEDFPNPLPVHTSFHRTTDAMRATAVSACVRLISGNVAKLPAPVYRRRGDDRVRDRTHPVDRLLNVRPNSWQTPLEFRRMMTANVALDGNAFALKRFEGATLTELIPLVGGMRIEQESFDLPPRYFFTPRKPAAAPEREYSPDEIFHLRDLTLDGVIGLSRVEQAKQGISLALGAETYATSFFVNGAEPGVGIVFDGELTPEQRQELLKSWKESHGGSYRAHAPFVIEGGGTIDRPQHSNKDSQMNELRGFQVEDIARLYGVPPHLIAHTEKQTSYGTGVEHMAIGFLQFHLLDWLVMWESAVQRDLIVDRAFMEHTVEGLLRADFKTRMEGYQLAIQNGILNPDEVRKLENRPPRTDGKGGEYWKPSNMAGDVEQPETQDEPLERPAAGLLPQDQWRAKIRGALRAVRESA